MVWQNAHPGGQLKVPMAVRKKLQLKEGDKVAFFVDDSGIRIANASLSALERAQAAFAGEAERPGLKTEQDIVAMMRKIRKEVSQKYSANPD